MAGMEGTNIGAGASPREGPDRWPKHLRWAIPLLVLVLLVVGWQALQLRANVGLGARTDVGGETAAGQEVTTGLQAVEAAPDGISAAPTADLPVSPVEGALAPDFTLTDLDGVEWTLSELRGSAVMLNFWATW